MKRTVHFSLLVCACLGVLLIASLRLATALPSGLVAWWSGDSNANDVSGHGHHATLTNGAQAGVPGLFGGAFQLDGVNDIVVTPLVLPAQGTIDLFVKPAALDTIDGIFGTFGTANGHDRLWLNARGPQGGLGVGPDHLVVNTGSCCVSEIVVPSPLVIGTWSHLAVSFDYVMDSYTLYTNGQMVGASTALRNVPTQWLDFGGQRSDFGQNFYWNGLIDEVHVFNRVLTASEIQELATLPAPVPEPATWLLLVPVCLALLAYTWRQRCDAAGTEEEKVPGAVSPGPECQDGAYITLEPPPHSVRSCVAPAMGRRSPRPLGAKGAEENPQAKGDIVCNNPFSVGSEP